MLERVLIELRTAGCPQEHVDALVQGAAQATEWLAAYEARQIEEQAAWEARRADPAQSVEVRSRFGRTHRRVVVRSTKASVWLAASRRSADGIRYSLKTMCEVGGRTFIVRGTSTHPAIGGAGHPIGPGDARGSGRGN